MPKYNFKKIDAFAAKKAMGNPAGAIYLTKDQIILEQDMQRIAFELQGTVCEVGFLRPLDSKEADYQLRYFSCEREVPFCGHATIAIMYDLFKTNELWSDKVSLRVQTNKGVLTVFNRCHEENAVYISAPEPQFIETRVSQAQVATALNLSLRAIVTKSFQIVNAGQNMLLVEVSSVENCLNMAPDYERLRAFCLENNIECVDVYTKRHDDFAFQVRVFAPTFGYLEDPATGSGNAALGYALYKDKRWLGESIALAQGVSSNEPNIVKLYYDQQLQRVVFGGGAIARIVGEYCLE